MHSRLLLPLVLTLGVASLFGCASVKVDPAYVADVAVLDSACTNGTATACTKLARLYLQPRDGQWHFPAMMTAWNRACDLKDPAGCGGLGDMYRIGWTNYEATVPDRPAAIAAYKRACDLGNCYWLTHLAQFDSLQAKRLADHKAEEEKSGAGTRAFLSGLDAFKAGRDAGQSNGDAIAMGAVAAGAADPESDVARAAAALGSQHLSSKAASAFSSASSGASSTGAVGTGSGGGARFSGPTQPNRAAGSCPGFTMANYRQKALDRNGDIQLGTQCGFAFEYYKAYLNAISQGYGAADVQRTYNVHTAAAKVAAQVAGMH